MMTREETALLCGTLTLAFPNWNISADSVELWHRLLEDVPSEIAMAVAQEWVMTSERYPTIAGIRRACAEKMADMPPTAIEAWGEVMNAIHDYGQNFYERGGRWSNHITREVVRSIGYSTICYSDKISVERAHFIKAYDEARDRYVKSVVSNREFDALGQPLIAIQHWSLTNQYPTVVELLPADSHWSTDHDN